MIEYNIEESTLKCHSAQIYIFLFLFNRLLGQLNQLKAMDLCNVRSSVASLFLYSAKVHMSQRITRIPLSVPQCWSRKYKLSMGSENANWREYIISKFVSILDFPRILLVLSDRKHIFLTLSWYPRNTWRISFPVNLLEILKHFNRNGNGLSEILKSQQFLFIHRGN